MEQLKLTHFYFCKKCPAYEAVFQQVEGEGVLRIPLSMRELNFVCRRPCEVSAPPPPLVRTVGALLDGIDLSPDRVSLDIRERDILSAYLHLNRQAKGASGGPGTEESMVPLPPGDGVVMSVYFGVPFYAPRESLVSADELEERHGLPKDSLRSGMEDEIVFHEDGHLHPNEEEFPAEGRIRAWLDKLRPEDFRSSL